MKSDGSLWAWGSNEYGWLAPNAPGPAPLLAYPVTVTNGSGGGDFVAGDIVTLTANAGSSGYQFNEWVISTPVLFVEGTNLNHATIKFVMPQGAVTATAAMAAVTELTVIAPTVSARPGSMVTFDITIENNPGIKGLNFNLTYDVDKLEFISLEAETGTAMTYDDENGVVGVTWLTNGATTLLETDGKLFTVVFKVKDSFRFGESPLGLSGYAANLHERLDPVFIDGAVIVHKLGEINGDGAVDLLDAICVQNIWLDSLTITQEGNRVPATQAQLLAADINGDGRVDANDLVLILRYLAGDPGIILY